MRRFFVDPDRIAGGKALITDHEARHLRLVLRIRPGVQIDLFDGAGRIYQAEITRVGKSVVEARIISCREIANEPPFLSLGLALLKGKKMDLVIQKATELGVTDIYPVRTQNCAVQAPSANQHLRWQRIAQEACKQCGRPNPLICRPYLDFPEFLARTRQVSAKIMLWENEKSRHINYLADLTPLKSLLLLIGPEGGFQNNELELAVEYGFISTSLGPRILRAETAAITAISISQFLLGNLEKEN